MPGAAGRRRPPETCPDARQVLAPADVIRLESDAVVMLDQTRLPGERVDRRCTTVSELCQAIRELAIRGAPAIGIAAAMGMAQAARTSGASELAALRADLRDARRQLAGSRPTAVNLGWALELCDEAIAAAVSAGELRAALIALARRIHEDEVARCRAMGRHGAELLPTGARVLTHCNAGALATGGYGSALGVVRAAHARDPGVHVWVDETRPLLQGARLTAWELAQEGIPHALIADAAAGQLFARGLVDAVVFGADRIARNGDAANKIGSYTLSVLAVAHQVPCYVVAPSSTIDHAIAGGAEIPIEERARDELSRLGDRVLAPEATPVSNPAFDVTPAANITAIVTEAGVHRAPFERSLPVSAL
ncbi:MAG: methylthioribose-phosphate isomerase [Gaiellales bacterium]|nr:methylthioribose-phosphate isomerase [Gaiellales bacterium]